jgi:hypothetical protein
MNTFEANRSTSYTFLFLRLSIVFKIEGVLRREVLRREFRDWKIL